MTVNLLCIRDPDYGNEYVSDGEVNQITIDIGGNWTDYKYFADDLAHGRLRALEFEQLILDEINHLPTDNPVRKAVEEYFATARIHGKD